jgi:glutamyl-tRNA synthetase
MRLLSEFDDLSGFFFAREDYDAADLIPKKKDAAFAREALAAARGRMAGAGEWTAAALEQAMQALCEERDWKRGQLYMPLRVATTCRRVSTPLFETMEVLGRDECLERMDQAIASLTG